MIVKVRIAPVEQWCEPSRTYGIKRGAPEVGLEVEIETKTMHNAETRSEDCNGRFWYLTPESGRRIRALVGWPIQQGEIYTICEHMLEMD